MKLQKIVVLVLILGLASACTREGETTPPSTVETPTSQTPITLTNNWNGYFLPKYETQQEKRERGGKADDIDDFMVANKEWYKITVPPQNPQNIRFPGEFEPMGYLLVGWIDGTLDQFFTDLVKGAWGYTTVILVNPGGSAQANMLQKLQSAGIPSSELTDGNHLVWLNAQLDSIWARDFGPQPVIHTDTGKMSVIDTRYYHYRYLDDIIPTYIGDGLGVNVFRASIEQEGGNFQANGTGHCFTSRGSIYRNTPDPDEAGHKKLYLDYFGCKELHFLFPLEGEGTTHIDMFMMVIGEKDIIVGEYSEANDCINRELLEKNVATLSGIKDADGNQMFRIHRIPMPPNSDGIWRTFTNFQMVRNPNDPSKGVVLVPVYAKYPTYQQEMLTKMAAAFQTAYGSSVTWTIKPINSDAIIPGNGAIHCVVHEIPKAIYEKQQTDPAGKCENTSLPHNCQTGGCGTITYAGYCDGNNRVYCNGNQVDYIPCAAPYAMRWGNNYPYEKICGPATFTGTNGQTISGFNCTSDYVCGSGCINQCSAGETGCTTDGKRYTCVMDIDGCYKQQPVACNQGEICVNGTCTAQDNCNGIDFVGTCEGNTVLWCENNQLNSIDCSTGNRICGLNTAQNYYDCIGGTVCNNECSSGETGCDANVAWTCSTSRANDCFVKVKTDCGSGTCKNGVCCTDECTADEKGCSLDKSQSYTCQADSNGCLKKVYKDCPGSDTCDAGTCASGCVDDCTNGETGCTTDKKSSWSCQTGTGGCLVKKPTACGSGSLCESGSCVTSCSDECTDGQKGCEPGNGAKWSCSKDSTSGCTVRQVTLCPPGQSCRNGECSGGGTTCANECTLGESGCFTGGSAAWVCQTQPGTLCTVKVTIPCASNQTCVDGSCQLPTVNPGGDTVDPGGDTTPGGTTDGGTNPKSVNASSCQQAPQADSTLPAWMLVFALGLLVGWRRRQRKA